MHRLYVFLCGGILVVLCVQLSQAQYIKLDQVSSHAIKQTTQKLVEAMRSKDESAVRKLAAESVAILGNLAGVLEVADEYRQAPKEVEPLARAEAQAGFEKILQQSIGIYVNSGE